MDRNSPLSTIHHDFIALQLILNPGIQPRTIEVAFRKQYGIKLNPWQTQRALKRVESRVAELKADEDLCFQVAKDVGVIRQTSKLIRIATLEKVIASAISNGHESAAIAAIGKIKEELVSEESTVEPVYNIILGNSDDHISTEDEVDDDDL